MTEVAAERTRSHWVSRRSFVELVLRHQADPGLTRDLAALSHETTDDLPPS